MIYLVLTFTEKVVDERILETALRKSTFVFLLFLEVLFSICSSHAFLK